MNAVVLKILQGNKMTVVPSDWVVELSNNDKDFKLTHTPCSATITGGSDTAENAQAMIVNNQTEHVCSV